MAPSEKQTRKEKIDPLVIEAGWEILPEGSDIPEQGNYAIEEFPTESGPMDYALFIDGILVGDIEAKSPDKGSPSILEQDKRYSESYLGGNFDFDGYHIPFLYASNGSKIWFQDLRLKRFLQRDITKFHTPGAIKELLGRDVEKSLEWLKNNSINFDYLRDFQQEAIEHVESAMQANKRKILLAMATGTGKTVVAAEIIYRLLKSGYGKRILFLVDRRVLAAQAVSRFSSYQPEPTMNLDKLYEVYHQKFRKEDLEGEKFNPNEFDPEKMNNPNPNDSFVFVCTVQRMQMKLFGRQGMFPWTEEDYYEDDEDDEIPPIHAFDVIIADESHRGYTTSEQSKWREVIDHFDAIKIGLTATPAETTTAYFDSPVFRYPVERAVREGNLVDWDLVRIDSGVRMNGLFLKEGEEVALMDPRTGLKKFEHLEDEREFSTTQLERLASSPDTNKKIIKEYAEYARAFEKEHKRFPKTIVFATNDLPNTSHADRIVDWIKDEFSDKGRDFVKKITGTVDRPLKKIREFRNKAVEPAIAVTVDLLSTGVDIPSCEAILFIRPVKSRILFEQILGRGTRLDNDIGKDHFTVFDAVGVVDYFKGATEFPEPATKKATKSYKEIVDELSNNKNREYNIKLLTRRLQRMAKNISFDGREKLSPFIEDGDVGKFAKQLPSLLENDFVKTIKLLQNESLQYNLKHYDRMKSDFVLAIQQEDDVSSEYFPIVVAGKEYKPEDYLELFKRLVKNEPDKIDALKILLTKPRDLNTDLLEELRTKLAATPEQFTVKNLRTAYQNNLADIIGMVKAAINDQEPLSTEIRVGLAMESIVQENKFSDEEKKWLHWIANHLTANLLIEKKHFSMIPFSAKGGWKKADQIFNGKLEDIIIRLNESMVS